MHANRGADSSRAERSRGKRCWTRSWPHDSSGARVMGINGRSGLKRDAMNAKELTFKSKFLSLVLRHQPELVGITLDGAGWVDVSELLIACTRHGKPMARETLEQIVATN